MLTTGKIHWKLFRLLVLILGGLALIAAAFWSMRIEPTLRATVAQEQIETARRAADRIADFIERRILELRAATQIGSFSEDPAAAAKSLRRLFELSPAVRQVTLVDAGGKELLRAPQRPPGSAEAPASYLDTPGFREAMRGETHVGPVHYGSAAEPFLTLAVPVKAGSQEIRGALIAEVGLKGLLDGVSLLGIGRPGSLYVLSRDGTLIASRGSPPPKSRDASGVTTPGAFVDGAAEVTTQPSGRQMLSTFATVPLARWRVVVEAPLEGAHADLGKLKSFGALVLTLAIVAMFLASATFSWRIAGSLSRLEEGVDRIAGGDLDHSLEIRTGDEIERLADRFNQMAAALKESRRSLEAKVAKRTAEISSLYAAIAPLKPADSFDKTLYAILSRLVETTAADAGLIRLWDHARRAFYSPAAIGLDRAWLENRDAEGGLVVTDEVLRSGAPIVCPDVAAEPRLQRKRQLSLGFSSCVFLPLKVGADILGVIQLYSRTRGFFCPEKTEQLLAIARQMGIALENRRLLDQVRRRNRDLQTLFTVTETVTRSLDLDSVSAAALRATTAALRVDAGCLYVADERGKVLRLAAHLGLPGDELHEIESYRPGEGIIGAIFAENKAVIYGDIDRDAGHHAQRARRWGFAALAGVPISVKGRPLGVLQVYSKRARAFDDREVRLLSTIGAQIGTAIENARLYEQSKRNFERIRALHEIDAAIAETLELRKVLDILMGKIELFLPIPAAYTVRLCDPVTGSLEPAACRNLDEDAWRAAGEAGCRALNESVRAARAPVVIRDIRTDPDARDCRFFVDQGFVSYLGVPLIAQGQVLGTIGLYTRSRHEFTPEEIELFATLAGQGALAMYNSRLYEQTKKQAIELKKSNQVKDQFLGVISHELRTPLSVILGYATLLESSLGDPRPEQLKAIHVIKEGSEKLLAMIQSILEATMLESGTMSVAREPVDLNRLANDLRNAYGERTAAGAAIVWSIAPNLPVALGDGYKIKQSLQHLIDNAVKFTPEGAITVSARYRPDRRAVCFEIADSGVGIAPEVMPFIFEKFRQADSSATRDHGGLGLGLYIARKFVELLGGEIVAESEVGRGSVFRVTLPWAEPAAPSASPAGAAPSPLDADSRR
ncbi:MAG TPA: GAF domain-containing protein [candidate division Zixibacteria bacterium]|nr:GAF domain-containing protein [candidate division Zixibacteria bacterium]